MTAGARARTALGALAAIVVITASWWALALWPAADAPTWVLRTRETCFGTAATGLPDAGGWLALVGQPLGMLLVLFAVWGKEVRDGLRATMRFVLGQLAVGVVGAALLAGVLGVVVRVRDADASTFASSPTEALAGQLNRLNDAPKPFALVDQTGRTVTLEQFRGKPVLVTFAYAHCETVCPLLVSEVLGARDRLGGRAPAVLIVTLDPWRDTPSRLPSIAERWGATGDAHVLGGSPEEVERVLNAWRIPRARNERTGDVSHPSVVYVVGADGRIAYVVTGSEPLIRAAVEAL
ncbi:MAG TPA: SCO family protein [Gemmatimonadaceae bacterium]|nr:SCO family protein [Gemmatimonadaceae bacterium]